MESLTLFRLHAAARLLKITYRLRTIPDLTKIKTVVLHFGTGSSEVKNLYDGINKT
jgi:hypothetical protein